MAMKSVYPPMALLTPPNSGKHHAANSFSSQSPGPNDPPIFPTNDDEGPRSPSPSEVTMKSGKSTSRRRTNWAEFNRTREEYQRARGEDYNVSANRSARFVKYDAPPANESPFRTPIPDEAQRAIIARSRHAALRKLLSQRQSSVSHEPEAVENLAYLVTHFSPMFKSWVDQNENGPAVKLRVNHKNQTILDLSANPELDKYFRSNEEVCKAPSAESSNTSGKRKDSGLGEYSPRKRAATPAAKVRQATTHSRKRSSLSESHFSKADSKATRMPAQKPPVSKDYRDWFDFAPSRHTLDKDKELAMTIARIDIAANNKVKDLTTDPNRNQLHAAELEVAKRLNIDCGKYLAVKRAVFNGYVKHLLSKHRKRELTVIETNQGLRSWNKTAAQQTCSIDVNTVSKLFGKFWEKLGWFDEQHYQDYIHNAHAVTFPAFDREGRVTKVGGFEA